MHFSRAPSPTQGRSPKLPPDQAGVLRETARPSHNRISRPPQTRTTIGTPIARNRSLRRSASKAVTFCHQRWSPPTRALLPVMHSSPVRSSLAIFITHNWAPLRAPPANSVHGDRRVVHPDDGRSQGNPGRTRREDPPPLLADLDCAVPGCDPFLRVCPGSSCRGHSGPVQLCHRSTRHEPTSLRTRPSAGRRRQHGRTPTAGDGEREPAGMVVPAAGAGDRSVRVPGQYMARHLSGRDRRSAGSGA